jgi:hypothetical protein
MPMIIRGVTVTLDGALWNGDVPRFSDLHFADVYGNDLFGIKQLSSQPGATSETIEFTGAYTMPTDTIGVIQLLAKTASPLGAGNVTVTIPRDGLQLADGGNGEPWTEFYPRAAFPVFTVTPAK